MFLIKQNIQKEYGVDNNTPIWKIGKLMAEHKLKSGDILARLDERRNNIKREN